MKTVDSSILGSSSSLPAFDDPCIEAQAVARGDQRDDEHIQRHLAACPECREGIAMVRRMAATLRTALATPARPGFPADVAGALRAEQLPRTARASFAVAAAAAVIFLTTILTGPVEQSPVSGPTAATRAIPAMPAENDRFWLRDTTPALVRTDQNLAAGSGLRAVPTQAMLVETF